MRLLVDTHVLLWVLKGSSKLSRDYYELLEDDKNTVIVSIASLWEIAVKVTIGKLEFKGSFQDFVSSKIEGQSLDILPLLPGHLDVLITLPLHHRDPFDRLIIAQAKTENLPVMTVDEVFENYNLKLV